MGVDTTGWMRNRGLTVIGGGHTVHLDWPDQKSLPGYGMARARTDLDHALAKRAVEAGARLYEGVTVTGAIQDGSGRVVGVTAKAGRGKSAATSRYAPPSPSTPGEWPRDWPPASASKRR